MGYNFGDEKFFYVGTATAGYSRFWFDGRKQIIHFHFLVLLLIAIDDDDDAAADWTTCAIKSSHDWNQQFPAVSADFSVQARRAFKVIT